MATAGFMAMAAAAAGIATEFDPKVQPTRASFWPFLFVAVMLTLLMFSMVRHLRRARENLGPAEPPAHPGVPESASGRRPRSRCAGAGHEVRLAPSTTAQEAPCPQPQQPPE